MSKQTDPYEAASALLIELQRQLRSESEEWRTKREDPYDLNYGVSIACAVHAEAIERTLKIAASWPKVRVFPTKGKPPIVNKCRNILRG